MTFAPTTTKLITCLWFDKEAQEAAKFYVDTFNNAPSTTNKHVIKSEILTTTTTNLLSTFLEKEGSNSVMAVSFSLAGASFLALSGNAKGQRHFEFTPAMSVQITCDGQDEIDYFWAKLIESGGKESYCGWCTDRFGVHWQVVPNRLGQMQSAQNSTDQARFARMHRYMMETMPKKLIEKDLIEAAEASG